MKLYILYNTQSKNLLTLNNKLIQMNTENTYKKENMKKIFKTQCAKGESTK